MKSERERENFDDETIKNFEEEEEEEEGEEERVVYALAEERRE